MQKYLHDRPRNGNFFDRGVPWRTTCQQRVDIELVIDAVKPSSAHSVLTTIVENGTEVKILRDNMFSGKAT